MKLFFLAIMFFSLSSGQLNDMIQKNVEISAKSSMQVLGKEEEKDGIKLWIHVRNKAQETVIKDSILIFSRTEIGDTAIEIMPLQIVKKGPIVSELRYFKENDKKNCEILFKNLKNSFKGLRLVNLSQQYKKVSWIKNGHFELWLSPKFEKF